MAGSSAWFLVDTNAFIQCRNLDQVDWAEITSARDVNLVVCASVLREIDNLKGSRKRARQFSKMIRPLLLDQQEFYELKKKDPTLRLLVVPDIGPSEDLRSKLDLSKPDNEIVASLKEFRAHYPQRDAQLLTHDSGPMGTAKRLGIPFVPIPDSWLLPVDSAARREIARLKDEIKQLAAQEPSFEIECLDDSGTRCDRLEVEVPRYKPLPDPELEELEERLKARFPAESTFEPDDPEMKDAVENLSPQMHRRFVAPPVNEIREYSEVAYPDWLERCRKIMASLHDNVQKRSDRPSFAARIKNCGTRPGRNALITIAVSGDFLIVTPESGNERKNAETQNGKLEPLRLPEPPAAPTWRWILCLKAGAADTPKAPQSIDLANLNLPQFQDFAKAVADARNVGQLSGAFVAPRALAMPDLRQPDPEAFYWKTGKAGRPGKIQVFECAQWRHSTNAELFQTEIWYPEGRESVSGAITVRVDAENLSRPEKRTIPVRVRVVETSTMPFAERLIDDLLARAKLSG